jgi:hypothetical protein
MRLDNAQGTHIVHIKIETCNVSIARLGTTGVVHIELDLTIGFVDGWRKIKRATELDKDMWALLSTTTEA